jgi:hypothetical protein
MRSGMRSVVRSIVRSTAIMTLLGFCAAAQAASTVIEKTISGFASPESVVIAGDQVFVSNLGIKLEPSAKDGDGFISRLDRDGNIKQLKWAEALNGPKGMIVVDGILYVADIDRVLGYRLRDAKQVFKLDMSATGSVFLNAFARYDNRRLLLSATDIGKVFIVDLSSRSYSELSFDTPPQGPNGMKYAGGRLMLAEWGTQSLPNGNVKAYRLQSSPGGLRATLEQTWAVQPAGYFDGMVDLGANRWLISNWVRFEAAGLLQVLDTRTGSVSVANPTFSIAGPADMTRDDQGKLWVPGMLEGKVYRINLRP